MLGRRQQVQVHQRYGDVHGHGDVLGYCPRRRVLDRLHEYLHQRRNGVLERRGCPLRTGRGHEQQLLDIQRPTDNLWASAKLRRSYGSSRLHMHSGLDLHKQRERLHERIHPRRMRRRRQWLLLQAEHDLLRWHDARLPEWGVRFVHSRNQTVLRERRSNLRNQRPMGNPSGVCSPRNVLAHQRSRRLHVRSLDLHRKGLCMPRRVHAGDMRHRRKQLPVRQRHSYDVPNSRGVFGVGPERGLLAHVLQYLLTGARDVRVGSPGPVCTRHYVRLLRVWQRRAVPEREADLHRHCRRLREVHVQRRPRVHEQRERLHQHVDARLVCRGPGGLLLPSHVDNVSRVVPQWGLRCVHAEYYPVLRQRRADLRCERPVGKPYCLRDTSDVHCDERHGGVVRLRCLNLLEERRGSNRLPGRTDARDVCRRYKQLPVRGHDFDMRESGRVFGPGAERRVRAHLHE